MPHARVQAIPRLAAFVAVQAAAWGAVALVRVAIDDGAGAGWSGPGASRVLFWQGIWAFSGALVSSGLAWLYVRAPESALRGRWLVAFVLGSSLAAALLWTSALEGLAALGGEGWLVPRWTQTWAARLLRRWLLLGVFAGAFAGVLLAGRMARDRERALRADALLHEARLEALRYQLNPHFLFNALASVIGLVDEDPRRAQEMLRALGQMLRRTLDADRSAVALREELEHIRLYLGFELLRFEERLEVSYEVAGELLDVLVPGMLLQPLVENAVKHGTFGVDRPLRLLIRAYRQSDRVVLEVENRGRLGSPGGLLPTRGAGVGLKNVSARLSTMYPRSHRFELTQKDELVLARAAFDPREAAP